MINLLFLILAGIVFGVVQAGIILPWLISNNITSTIGMIVLLFWDMFFIGIFYVYLFSTIIKRAKK